MAKQEKQDEFRYGSASLPQGERKYSILRWSWSGLNRSDKADTGQLTDAAGILCDPPNLYPLRDPKEISALRYAEPISIAGFDGNLLVVYRANNKIKADYCKIGNPMGIYTHVIGDALGTDADFAIRTAAQFNTVDTSSGSVPSYTYDRRIVIFPDAFSIPFYYADQSPGGSIRTPTNAVPYMSLVATYASRLFGVDENNVYASAYNNYADYSLDTAEDVSAAHAWMSMSQSNTKADGTFTAIASYDNHVVLFKKDFMQLVYNNKNPFRIVDVGAYGCDSQMAVCEMNGALYFASQDAVYAYAGGTPKVISKNLDIKDFSGAILGAFKDTLYLFHDGLLYAFKNGAWSCLGKPQAEDKDAEIVQFATLDYGICALTKGDGFTGSRVYFIDWAEEAAENATGLDWTPTYSADWWFESDFMMRARGGLLNVRRAKKLTVLCEGVENAEIAAYLLTDDEIFDPDTARLVGSITFSEDGIRELRVLTRQFSGWAHRLRFVGSGYVKIWAVELQVSWGGDLYVEG